MNINSILPYVCCVFLVSAPLMLLAQEGDAPAKAKSRLALNVNQYSDDRIELSALLRARIEGSYEKIANGEIQFIATDSTGTETTLGTAKTGQNGIALLEIQADKLIAHQEGYSCIARYDGSAELTSTEADVTFSRARLTLVAGGNDSLRTLELSALDLSGDSPIPIPDQQVTVFVKRLFSNLKVGEGTTDENGTTSIDIPADLPGDENGALTFVAKIEETEGYGNLIANAEEPWGIPVSYSQKSLPRALWSPHPPLWMVITFFILMGTVWVHYLIIVFKLFKIRGEHSSQPGT